MSFSNQSVIKGYWVKSIPPANVFHSEKVPPKTSDSTYPKVGTAKLFCPTKEYYIVYCIGEKKNNSENRIFF